MSNRKMVPGLSHQFRWASKDGLFFAAIDAAGGWPIGFAYVGFEHTDERAVGFTNSPHNDGWWTVLASADDYYVWKLSPQALQRIVDAVIRSTTVNAPKASALWIKSSSGHRAAITEAKEQP
jgi:hypothetical protein